MAGGRVLVILWSGALGGLFLWSVLAETPSNIPVSEFAEWYATFAVAGFLTMFLSRPPFSSGWRAGIRTIMIVNGGDEPALGFSLPALSWTGLSALVVFGPGLCPTRPGLSPPWEDSPG